MRFNSPVAGKAIQWQRKLREMKVGDSFITSEHYMTAVYTAAKKLGCKVTRKSQKRECPVTFTTVVEVFLVEPAPKEKPLPGKRQRRRIKP